MYFLPFRGDQQWCIEYTSQRAGIDLKLTSTLLPIQYFQWFCLISHSPVGASRAYCMNTYLRPNLPIFPSDVCGGGRGGFDALLRRKNLLKNHYGMQMVTDMNNDGDIGKKNNLTEKFFCFIFLKYD